MVAEIADEYRVADMSMTSFNECTASARACVLAAHRSVFVARRAAVQNHLFQGDNCGTVGGNSAVLFERRSADQDLPDADVD